MDCIAMNNQEMTHNVLTAENWIPVFVQVHIISFILGVLLSSTIIPKVSYLISALINIFVYMSIIGVMSYVILGITLSYI